MLKHWDFQKVDKESAKELAEECGIDPLLALILLRRGFSDPMEIDEFFSDDIQLSDPFELPGMEEAVARIHAALERNERIAVYGDYDADGVTASAVLYQYLLKAGANVMCYIPERLTEGYGMSREAIDYLRDKEIQLIITVDNGISAAEETAYAVSLGMDVVITDHHIPPEVLPKAAAVVDPHTSDGGDIFTGYAGVGVAFKLICALENCPCEDLLAEYADLVAIGTVADIVPLKGENRVLVRAGLSRINSSPRPGVAALMRVAGLEGKEVSAENIAFALSPRINAAGRMGKSLRAFQLMTGSENDDLDELAAEIQDENSSRQAIEAQIMKEACQQILSDEKLLYAKIIVVSGNGWHEGVLGIVASRICEYFGKPALVISVDGSRAKGSGRSLPGFDLFQALSACTDTLIAFGGHRQAAGITLDSAKINELFEAINAYASSLPSMPVPSLTVDCRLNPVGVNGDTANALQKMEPFGCENNQPLFAVCGAELYAVHPLSGGKHLKLTFDKNGQQFVCLLFSVAVGDFLFVPGDKLDVAIRFRITEYQGKPGFSVVVRDLRRAGLDEDRYFRSVSLYESFRRGEQLSDEAKAELYSDREEIGRVYRYLRNFKSYDGTYEEFCVKAGFCREEYGKIRVALDVLEELSFIAQNCDGRHLSLELMPTASRRELSESKIYNQWGR